MTSPPTTVPAAPPRSISRRPSRFLEGSPLTGAEIPLTQDPYLISVLSAMDSYEQNRKRQSHHHGSGSSSSSSLESFMACERVSGGSGTAVTGAEEEDRGSRDDIPTPVQDVLKDFLKGRFRALTGTKDRREKGLSLS